MLILNGEEIKLNLTHKKYYKIMDIFELKGEELTLFDLIEIAKILELEHKILKEELLEILKYITTTRFPKVGIDNELRSFSIFDDFDMIYYEFKKLRIDLIDEDIPLFKFNAILTGLFHEENALTKRIENRGSKIDKNDTPEIRKNKLNNKMIYKIKPRRTGGD